MVRCVPGFDILKTTRSFVNMMMRGRSHGRHGNSLAVRGIPTRRAIWLATMVVAVVLGAVAVMLGNLASQAAGRQSEEAKIQRESDDTLEPVSDAVDVGAGSTGSSDAMLTDLAGEGTAQDDGVGDDSLDASAIGDDQAYPADNVSYIRRFAAPERLRHGGSDLVPADFMSVTVTLVDGERFKGAQTIDGIWDRSIDNDGDGEPDNGTTIVAQTFTSIIMYGPADADCEWLVGRATPPAAAMSGVRMTDTQEVRNDNNGTEVDGIEYDPTSGLVYMRKDAMAEGDGGVGKKLGSNRIQVMGVCDGRDTARVSVPMTVEKGGARVDAVPVESVLESDATNLSTRIRLADEGNADAIDESVIDSVEMNGYPVTRDVKDDDGNKVGEQWDYDRVTGVMTLRTSPLTVTSLRIRMSDTGAKRLSRTLGDVGGLLVGRAEAASGPDTLPGEWRVDNPPVQEGWKERFKIAEAGDSTSHQSLNSRIPTEMYSKGNFEANLVDYIRHWDWKPQYDWYHSGNWRDKPTVITR